MDVFASNLSAQTSNSLYPLTQWTSNAAKFSSNMAANTSNTLYPIVYSTSNSLDSTSNIASFSSNLAGETSNILYPLSMFASNMSAQNRYTAQYASNTAFFSSNMVVSTSNCAWFASNIATNTSNTMYPNSYFSSNASVFASNAAAYASNTSYVSSNLLSITSNVAWSTQAFAETMSNFAYIAYSNSIYGSNTANSTSNLVHTTLQSNIDKTIAASNQAFTVAATGWRYNIAGNLYALSNISIGMSNTSGLTLDLGQGSLGASNIFTEPVAFRFSAPSNTTIITSNYDPGSSMVGSNNNPINGLITFTIAASNMPSTVITQGGFLAPKKGVYTVSANIGVESRGFDAVKLVLTQAPHALFDRDTMSNINAYAISTAETPTNYNVGIAAVNNLGYVIPQRATLSVSTTTLANANDVFQCFLITHHTTRSNAATTYVNVQSNTPVTINDNSFSGVMVSQMQ